MNLSPDNIEAAGQIVNMYHERQESRGGLFRRMSEIRDHYNGDVVVPLPELDDAEKPAVPNLIAQGIDAFAQRVASTMPNINYPALRPGIQTSENKARDRRLATVGWWKMNKMNTKVRRRSRHLTAYGMSVVSLSPVGLEKSDKRDIPYWRVRNPLSSYPAEMIDPDSMEPRDCIFVDRRPLRWLKDHYPAQTQVLYRGDKTDAGMFEILEYIDDCETILIAIGAEKPKSNPYQVETGKGVASNIILERIPNRAEICPVVVAGRITLDRLQGQFDQMMGMYQRQAKLDALSLIAAQRGVFPELWVVSPANSPTSPRIVQEADGLTGELGQIDRGQIQVVNPQQTQDIQNAIANLERAARFAGNVPQEFAGESATNIRTASRGETLLSSAVDFYLQEYQEILANSFEHENLRAVRIQKAYYGNKPSMFFFGSDGKMTRTDYIPDETFETDQCYVHYSLPGSDANAMAVRIGQKIGIGLMSNETGRELDPDIEDSISEGDRVEIEGLRKALLTGLEQVAAQGDPSIIPVIAGIAKKKAERHMTIEDAVAAVHKEMQDAQQDQAAQQGAPPAAGPEAQPGMGVGPENPPQNGMPTAKPSLQEALASLGGGGPQMAPAVAQAPAPAPAGV